MLPWSVVVGSLQMGPRPVTLPARHLIRSNSRRCVDAPHLLTPGSAWPVEWSKGRTGRTPGGRHGSNLDKTTLVVATSTELPFLHCHLASAHDCVPFSLFVSVPLLASTFRTVDMSFFKNITDKFDNLGIGDSKRDEAQGTRDYGYHGPGDNPPPAQYVASPPPPAYQPPSDKPPIPSGWTPLFDQSHQRWYYVEEATGRSQWEAPGYTPPAGDDSRAGFGAPTGYGAPAGPPPPGYGGGGGGYDQQPSQEKKGSGKGGMLLGAAGGLAAGAVGGALLHHALSDSDSDKEEHHSYAAPAPYQPAPYQPQPEYYPEASYAAAVPPPVLPPTDADGSSVSSSDREEVQEARERYEEALADAADSDASSSEEEELEEAREEYYEEYEDTYGGDDDY
ncbi:hypothetical protein PCL_01996 [Purpureocillium lilacinum]|uniref:WW domain-containing protein n=1 Tax=Purpureocillium lilacinum TaxID=33203 RepID=A0A2U3E159_PURLI|nr:hypothetical protein PCL_01996 [Purpureocillium lilacinum]